MRAKKNQLQKILVGKNLAIENIHSDLNRNPLRINILSIFPSFQFISSPTPSQRNLTEKTPEDVCNYYHLISPWNNNRSEYIIELKTFAASLASPRNMAWRMSASLASLAYFWKRKFWRVLALAKFVREWPLLN